MPLRIGIVDFNPDKSPDLREYPRRIGSLFPPDVVWVGLPFNDYPNISGYDALFLSGSRLSATKYQQMVKEGNIIGKEYEHVDLVAKKLLEYDGPIFGICFGAQLLAHTMGGILGSLQKTEAGYLQHQLTPEGREDPVFGYLSDQFYGAHLHRDYVSVLPTGPHIQRDDVLAIRNGFNHAFRIIGKNGIIRYGVQPHPEMSTPNGANLLVRLNKHWLIDEIGEPEYNKALTIPPVAVFELGKTITRFVENLRKT